MRPLHTTILILPFLLLPGCFGGTQRPYAIDLDKMRVELTPTDPRLLAETPAVKPAARTAVVRVQRDWLDPVRPDSEQIVLYPLPWDRGFDAMPGAFALHDSATTLLPLGHTEPEAARELLARARATNADRLLIITTTNIQSTDSWLGILALPTLGLMPNMFGQAESCAAAMLVDVPSGRVVNAIEHTETAWQPANLWTVASACDDASGRAVPRAIEGLARQTGTAFAPRSEQVNTPFAKREHPLGG